MAVSWPYAVTRWVSPVVFAVIALLAFPTYAAVDGLKKFEPVFALVVVGEPPPMVAAPAQRNDLYAKLNDLIAGNGSSGHIARMQGSAALANSPHMSQRDFALFAGPERRNWRERPL